MKPNQFAPFIQTVFSEDREFQEEIENYIGVQLDQVDFVDLHNQIKVVDYEKGPPEVVTISVAFSADIRNHAKGERLHGEIPKCKAKINRNPNTLELFDLEPLIETDFNS